MKPVDQQPILAENAEIEALLARDGAQFRDQYIDNNGFSDRVMARVATLAANERASVRLSNKARLMIIASTTFIALMIALTVGAGSNYLIDAVMDLATKTITPAVVGLAMLMVAAGVMAFSAASND
jgi:hypothetical protein